MVDSWAINAPGNFTDLESLTQYLTNHNSFDEKDKVRSFYMWIADNISIDIKALSSFAEGETRPQVVFDTKKTLAKGYAKLFKEMCDKSTIKCEIIEGYYKDNLYFPGKKLTSPNHSWNAVYMNNDWHLIDVSLASGEIKNKSTFFQKCIAGISGKNAINSVAYFEKKINENYFFVPPQQFLLTHLPANPMWQLVNNPVDLSVFRSDSAMIIKHLNNSEKTANYIDSINVFLNSPKEKQMIFRATQANTFNPDNYSTPANIYLTLGNDYYNQAKLNKGLSKREKIQLYKTSKKYASKALVNYKSQLSEISATHKEIKTWQKELSRSRLKLYKTAIKENQKIIDKNKKDLDKISDRKKDINKRINYVNYDTYPFTDDESIFYTERPASFFLPEDSMIVIDLYTDHRLNFDTISILIKKIDSICHVSNDDLHFSVKIDRSMINDSTFRNIDDLNRIIELISLNNNKQYYPLKQDHEAIVQRRANIIEMRDTILEVERRGFKSNYTVIKEYRKKVGALTKANKKLLKTIKKINANDTYEDQQFAELNDNYLRLSYMIIDRYFQEITEIKRESPILKNQNKLMELEIKMFKKTSKTETARYNKESELENNRYQSERSNNKVNYKKAKSISSLSDKEISKLRKS